MILIVYGLYYIYNHERRIGLLYVMCMFFYFVYTVSHFSYAPFFQGPHFLTKMVESNIVDDNLFTDILSV